MVEKPTYIPSRLKNCAIGGHVAGASDIVDDEKGKTQDVINADTEDSIDSINTAIGDDDTEGTIKGRLKDIEEIIGSGGAIDERIANAIKALDSEVSHTSADNKVAITVTETDGKLTGVELVTDDIASAATVAQNKQDLDAEISSINSKIVPEASASNKLIDKKYVDDLLQAEETRARAAEEGNANNISSEVTRAQGVESSLQTAITDEVTRAKAAEKVNADDIDAIEGKIPSQASTINQLADKDFVNSSISTATATFKGTYNTLEELQAVTADNNDYGFVVSQDAAGNTVYNRYKFDGTQWSFEYALNNSSFTSEQWAAISSGITSGHKDKLNALPNNQELTESLSSKQNVISDLDAIRSGAQAGSTAYQLPSGGIPKNNLSENVQTSLTKADEAAPQATTYTKDEVDLALGSKQDTLTFDETPTLNSNNPVKSNGIKVALNAKQDNISDLSDIRSGASLGSTAYQKPSEGIPESDLDDSTQSKIDAGSTAYQKPQVGIPSSDMTEAVQQSLSKADTALQEHQSLEAYYTKTETDSLLGDKQDTIDDLQTIRDGAEAGSTAYQKPEGNIPYSDLSTEVQDSLDKADAAAPQSTTYTKTEVDNALAGKQDTLTFDNAPTENSTNPVKSGGVYSALSGKQDTISNLQSIIDGANAGATAYQLPNGGIPEATLTQELQDKINSGGNAYTKPEGGIPSSDMTQAVQDSLSNADTAVQPSALDDYQEKLVDGENIKTINNMSVLGSGNITISTTGVSWDDDPMMDGEASAGTSEAYARGDHRHPSDTSKQDVLTFITSQEAITAANELT